MSDKTGFTYEHWEGRDEYIILGFGGPIGPTVTKKEVEIITNWLNLSLPELKTRMIEDVFKGPVMDSKWIV